ncbi:MAG TPA: 16S rRNA (cytosine(967)-C(5))-methyltransferase RsmB [Acidiferrobacterales bacterium]
MSVARTRHRVLRSPGGQGRALPARAVAAQVVQQVAAGRSLDDALNQALARLPVARGGETALIQELCYGALRWWHRLRRLLDERLERPLRAQDADVDALLVIGLHQLLHMRVAPHAAVSETVEAAVALGKSWAKPLINGVLRAVARELAAVAARIDADPELLLSHPAWLVERLRAAWPEHWAALLEANNRHPPMALRVNLRRGGRDAYRARLRAAGLDADADPHGDAGLILRQPVPVDALPGFRDGDVSVQDLAAQLAAALLDAAPGDTVLDACAAPGGKACHLLECVPDLKLVAVDRDAARLDRVADNLARLQLDARLIAGDAAAPQDWWDGAPFAHILLDAPCSATGVIRRHPDIKLHRRPGDIVALAAQQARLLDGLWPWLAPGGKLLYVTCSVLPEENERQIEAFLARHPDAGALPLALDFAHALTVGYQVLPGEGEMDGFYYACLSKSPRG